MSNNKENFLDSQSLIALAFLALSWLGWSYYMRQKYPPQPNPAPISQAEEEAFGKEKENSPSTHSRKSFLAPEKEQILKFEGEDIELIFSSHGFGIKKVIFKNYFDRDKKPVVFESPGSPFFASHFFKDKTPIPFQIKKEGNVLTGVFSSPEGRIKKRIEIENKHFLLKSKVEIEPGKKAGLKGLSLDFSHSLPKQSEGFLSSFLLYGQDILKTFVSYEGNQSEKPTEEELESRPSYSLVNVGALGGKYFGKAFINKSNIFPSLTLSKTENQARAELNYELLHSKKQSLEYEIFLGPKSLKNFQDLGGPIQNWLDFGFFSWLARPLLLFLNWLYSWCYNWGLAIVLLTCFIRLALLPINLKSYKSMKVMQKIQPEMKQLRETHKADPKKMNQEVMALMKKNKANPLGGCLPLFIQFPIFFALYRVLGESIELYQSPFILWVHDLSLKDPYYVLPILAGLTLFVQQKITPMNLPKEQARLLTAMPLLFSVFMLGLPSGLTLYIFVSGLFGLVQQFVFVKSGLSLKGG